MIKLFVIKIGGNTLDDVDQRVAFLKNFTAIREPKILIHGGGKIATDIGMKLGIEPNYVQGRRITDEKTIELVTMVYGGLVNKTLVATLQQLGCNAMGMTGADGNMLKATRRAAKEIDFGFVGDVTPNSVNTALLLSLLKQNIVAVIAPLSHSEGAILNTNADTIASVMSIALSKHFDVRLIYCFEKKGVLRSVEDNDSVIHRLTKQHYDDLLQQNVLVDGILPKLENAFAAIQHGVKEVLIGNAHHVLKNTGMETEGTLITLN
jgi:acetylglutamate kinase